MDFARRWADLHGVAVAGWYLDDGVSGTLPLRQRPAGHRLLEDAQAGKFGLVLVYRLDRLARSTRHLLDAVDELAKYGVGIRSMTEEFNSETPTGRFILTTLASIAELERSTILERMAQGRRRRAREGRWQGGPIPYGYRLDAEGRLVIDDEPMPGCPWSAADVVRMIFAAMASGGTTVAVAQQMTELGVPAIVRYMDRHGNVTIRHHGTRWLPSRVRTLLTNPVYKGVLRQHGVETACPALVTPTQWEEANRTLRRNRAIPRHGVRTYILRGLLYCGLCGSRFSGTSGASHGRHYHIYRCGGQLPTTGRHCPAKTLMADKVEAAVWHQALHILARTEPPGDDPLAGSGQPDTDAQRKALEDALRRKAQERDRLLGLYRRGIIDDATLERQLAEVQAEEDRLREELARLQHAGRSEEGQALLAEARRLAAERGDWDPETQRRILQLLIDRIVVHTTFRPERRGRYAKEASLEIFWRV
ncbi:MAG: recombinase family protein [Bacillota bacterium]|nr:MAG: recombinase family protein [Bacillota bacterium]